MIVPWWYNGFVLVRMVTIGQRTYITRRVLMTNLIIGWSVALSCKPKCNTAAMSMSGNHYAAGEVNAFAQATEVVRKAASLQMGQLDGSFAATTNLACVWWHIWWWCNAN